MIPKGVGVGRPADQATQIPRIDLSKVGKSKRLAKQNKNYLDLLSIVTRSRYGFVAEQARLKSEPAKNAATQILRQLDLIIHMVQLPYVILMMMEGYKSGWEQAFKVVLRGPKPNQGDRKKRFEKCAKSAMQQFFAIDVSGSLSRPWLFAVTLYIWTAFECLATDLWATSLNRATPLGHRILSSISGEDAEKSGLSRRHIEVGLAARYGFDLRRHLGTILKSKFDFRSCDGIQSAYKQAFGNCGKPPEWATLKELEQVRHLIVHRGGVVDSKFAKVTNLRVRPDRTLSLTLPQVGGYMMSVTLACADLLKIVDEWFTAQG